MITGQGFDPKGVDGVFGKSTLKATQDFQKKYQLDADGIVGNKTLGAAARLGLQIAVDESADRHSLNFPPRPDFPALSHKRRVELFGAFDFKHEPVQGNYENIKILGNWEKENIEQVVTPQLIGVKGANRAGLVRIHKKIREHFLGLWQAWEDEGLMGKVLTFEGAFNARFIRGAAIPENAGKAEKLSNHAWGTAFDINYAWNQLGHVPALVGQKGCVRELVSTANRFGFYWGGHFDRRLDGMHFELAVLK